MFNRSQTLKTKRKRPNWFSILSVIVLANFTWIIVFIDGKETAELNLRLQNKGITTSGTVVKLHWNAWGRSWPEVTFEVNSKTYMFEFRTNLRKYEVGEQVMARYDPADPNIAQIDSDEGRKFAMSETSLAILLAFFFNFMFIWGMWRQIQFNRMAARSYRLDPPSS